MEYENDDFYNTAACTFLIDVTSVWVSKVSKVTKKKKLKLMIKPKKRENRKHALNNNTMENF